MMYFLDYYAESVNKRGTIPVLFTDGTKNDAVTMKQEDIDSGKIYRYLKENGIGRDNFVMICMPRGPQTVIAMIGVLKAGAAFVLAEDTYPKERISFIRDNCNCCLTLDKRLYAKIMEYETLSGYEKAGDNDAAFAIYTSGTTGRPKGVIHEYGKFKYILKPVFSNRATSINEEILHSLRFAMIPPLSFVAAMIIMIPIICFGAVVYIPPYKLIKNPMNFIEFIARENITDTFMTSTMKELLGNLPSCVKRVHFGGEEVSNIAPVPGINYYNRYGMSESGFIIADFLIDGSYEIVPVGKSYEGIDIQILDEKGNILQGNEEGEVCFRNEYTRGYINMPEMTKTAFAGGLFHTGDTGYRDSRGNLILLGRIDDMIKINGNRIEPDEIENDIYEVYGIKSVVRSFAEGKRAFIAAYYLKKDGENLLEGKSTAEINRPLRDKMPAYMLPAVYCEIDAFPVSENGKLQRNRLPSPHFKTNPYEKPKTDTERYLCQKMAEVLHLERVGVNDRFDEIGGTSMQEMELLAACSKLQFDAEDLRVYPSPRLLGKFCEEHAKEAENRRSAEEKARKHSYPLLSGQKIIMHFYEQETEMISTNLSKLVTLAKETNVVRFTEALNKALKAHPALHTKFYTDSNGITKQKYDSALFEPVKIKKIDNSEFEKLRTKLIRPFTDFTSKLYRAEVYQTEDQNIFFFDACHLIMDGESTRILSRDIYGFYRDDSYEPEPDYYYLLLKQNKENLERESIDGQASYNALFGEKNDWRDAYFPADYDREGLALGAIRESLLLSDVSMLNNSLIVAGCLSGIAEYAKKKEAIAYSTVEARDDSMRASTVGMLVKYLPVYLNYDEKQEPKKLIRQVKTQIETGLKYRSWSWLLCHTDPTKVMRIIYQKYMFSKQESDTLYGTGLDFKIQEQISGIGSINILDMDDGKGVTFNAKYNKDMLKQESMRRLIDCIKKGIINLSEDNLC